MPSVRTKFSVGLFVILGMTTVIVFVLWLGMSQYLKEGRHYVAFFDESVQGLKKDSAIKYRGVAIGRVESIRVAEDGKLIRILFNLDEPLKNHDKMIAKIKSIGITGIMFVELERMETGDILLSPKILFKTKYPVIATRSSDMKQLLTDIYDILDTFKQIDFKGIADRIIETLDNANQTFEDAEVKQISENIQKTLLQSQAILKNEKWEEIAQNIHQASNNINLLIKNADSTVSHVDGSFIKHNKKLSKAIDEFNHAAENASELLQNGTVLISDTHSSVSRIDQKLLETLNALETTSINMNKLIQQLADQPSMLLFSSPPPPKSIETEKD
jgi:phospholipid/cholesterol/gamma-HCH transport system substrate-binding protein